MADYNLPDVVDKRLRYFDGQYLQDQDFIDEQNYQRDREHRQNRLLHGPGIAEGLTVSKTGKPNEVQVSPGTAIDSDGFQLVLKDATNVDLPGGTYNGKQGIGLYLSYQEIPADEATSGPGTKDYTRWQELPDLTPALPGQNEPGVLLALLTLDNSGNVVATDSSVRTYTGARLPGPAADGATLRTLSSGRVDLNCSLTVNGSPTSTAAQPALHAKIAPPPQGQQPVPLCALRVEAGSFGTKENAVASQLLLVQDSGVQGGLGNYLVVRGDGNVGVGTASPDVRLHVVGGGGTSVDLVVSGRLKSDSSDGGLWVSGDRFIGGHGTGVGFFSGGAWRLAVVPEGHVGIGTETPENSEGWTRVVDVLGSVSTKLSVRTTGVEARVQAHDTGWWGSAPGMVIGTKTANALSFATSAATRMTVTAAGLVGIGTTKPGANVHVYVPKQSTPIYAQRLEIESFGTTQNAQSSFFLQARDLGNADSNNGFIVRGDGALGVGTNQPGSYLDIRVPVPDKITPIHALRIGVKGFMTVDNRKSSYFIEARDFGDPGIFFGVRGDGSVGIGTDDLSGMKLKVAGQTWIDGDLWVTGGMAIYRNADGLGWKGFGPGKDALGQRLMYWGDAPAPSDIRLKAEVRPVSGALRMVQELRGIRFRWSEGGLDYLTREVADGVSAGPGATSEQHHQIKEAERRRAVEALAGDWMGLIAQDVEAVAPELVFEDEDGYKHIRYQHLTALLVEAVKEQDALVRSLSATVNARQRGRSAQAERAREGQ